MYMLFRIIQQKRYKIGYLHTARFLSVPDEGYFRKASCALNLISTFLFLIVRLWAMPHNLKCIFLMV